MKRLRLLCIVLVLSTANVETSAAEETKTAFQPVVTMRGALTNSRIAFERDKVGHVAFMGGSITEMEGYRPRVADWLKKRYPQTKFTFTNAGISSTCSTTGAHRLQRDVLSKGPVDLFFVEFAVNDDQDAAHQRQECIRGMEGVVRQMRRSNPNADIVMVHFVNPPILSAIQQKTSRISRPAHEAVAKHYSVPTVDVAASLAAAIENKALTWKQFGGTHPGPAGNDFAAKLATDLLKDAWSKPLADSVKQTEHAVPQNPLDAFSYFEGHFVSPEQFANRGGFRWRVPDWKQIRGGKRDRFTGRKLLEATQPDSTLTIPFEGTSIGVFVVAGPDAGSLEVSIDGSEPQTIDLYHRYSKGLHYPRTVMLGTDLADRKHTLKAKVIAKEGRSAIRILEFAVNGE